MHISEKGNKQIALYIRQYFSMFGRHREFSFELYDSKYIIAISVNYFTDAEDSLQLKAS